MEGCRSQAGAEGTAERQVNMTIASLTSEEREVVRRTMEATFRYFDRDFHSRLGVTPEEMRSLLIVWPTIDDSDDRSLACVAINNSFNDLLHGEGIGEVEAIESTGATRAEMRRIYAKWVTARGWSVTGNR